MTTNVPIVILAAGRGSRMKELTEKSQKVLLRVGDKPMLHITLERFYNEGFRHFVIVVGYRKEDVVGYFGDGGVIGEGVKIDYVIQPNIKGGTADAVRCVIPKLEGCQTNKFVLVYGDVIPSSKTISYLKECVVKPSSVCVMTTRVVTDPQRYGVVEVDGDCITHIVEKSPNPPTNMINAGIYVLTNGILEYVEQTPISQRGEYELTTTLEMWMKAYPKKLKWLCIDDTLDIGTIEDYNRTNLNEVI